MEDMTKEVEDRAVPPFIAIIVVFLAMMLGGGIGAVIQWNADQDKIVKVPESTDCFDKGQRYGMHLCGKFPTEWECLSPEQQEAAKRYAKEHVN